MINNFNCDKQHAGSWQVRSNSAIDLLLRHSNDWISLDQPLRIADLGCGNEHLKILLQSRLNLSFKYQGYDLHPQQDSTRQIDLTAEIPSGLFDLVFCLGLLEYIPNLEQLLASLASKTQWLIISYVVNDSKVYSLSEIDKNGWLHHYSVADINNKLTKSGLLNEGFLLTNGGRTGIWLLKSKVFNLKCVKG